MFGIFWRKHFEKIVLNITGLESGYCGVQYNTGICAKKKKGFRPAVRFTRWTELKYHQTIVNHEEKVRNHYHGQNSINRSRNRETVE